MKNEKLLPELVLTSDQIRINEQFKMLLELSEHVETTRERLKLLGVS